MARPARSSAGCNTAGRRVLYVQSFAQGDPYAPLGFALTAQGLYAAVKKKAEERRQEKADTFNAYLDDLVAVGSWQLMLDHFEWYVKLAKRLGIKVQPPSAVSFGKATDPSRRSVASARQSWGSRLTTASSWWEEYRS